jgi:hypothetical protein
MHPGGVTGPPHGFTTIADRERLAESAKLQNLIEQTPQGVYEHYKGGTYTVLAIVSYHEHREPMVLYVSHKTGNVQVRELRQSPLWGTHHVDAWTDVVSYPDGPGTTSCRRFRLVRSLG